MIKQTVTVLYILYLSIVTASGYTSTPREITCPVDGKRFTIHVTASYTTFNTLKDFQKEGAIGYLYEHMVNACPACHYAGYEEDFDTTFTESAKAGIVKILEPFRAVTPDDVSEQEIAVKLYQYFNRSNGEIADLYLIASYFLRNDTARIEKRKELQRSCAHYFIKATEQKEYEEPAIYASIWYLIGDLYRRTGDFAIALTYFDLAAHASEKEEGLSEILTTQREMAVRKDENNSI